VEEMSIVPRILSEYTRNGTAKSLQEFHQECVQWALDRHSLDRAIEPTWILQSHLGVVYIRTPWNENEEKNMVAQTIKMMMKNFHMTYYCLVSEAWAVTISVEEIKKRGGTYEVPEGGLVTVPGRIEILMISSEDKKSSMGTSFEIVRNGWKVTLDNRTDTSASPEDKGRFMGLLKE